MTPEEQRFKTYENRLRRAAYRQGLCMSKPRGFDNCYLLCNTITGNLDAWDMDVDGVADHLGVDRYEPQHKPERAPVRLRPPPPTS